MIRFERAFVWAGGAAFVASIAFFVWWYFVALHQLRQWTGWGPVALDLGLFSVFALHHSVFARDPIKQRLTAIPAHLRRSVYVWIASLLLAAVILAWQPVGSALYVVTGVAAIGLAGVQAIGVLLIARAVGRIDPLELAGIREPEDARRHTSTIAGGETLQTAGPYRWVRHPLYLGWVLVVFGGAAMTGDRLTFAVISTLYLVIAVPYEEQSLMRAFGDEYARYRQRVRWRIVPYVY